MTAHKQKPTITPERVAWFAEYYRVNPAWGVFHVALDDNNYTLGAASGATWNKARNEWGPPYRTGKDWPADVREAAEWFDKLTPSQRRRLGEKARDIVDVLVPGHKVSTGRVIVTAIDKDNGTITLEAKP